MKRRLPSVAVLIIATIAVVAAQEGYIVGDVLKVSEIQDSLGNQVIDVDNREGVLEEITINKTHVGADFIVYPDGGTYTVIYGNNLSVAYTDTDPTAAIEWAINALPSGGGKVVLASGTYTLTSTIDITKSNVELAGSGFSTELVMRNWADVHTIMVDGASGVKIRDLYIYVPLTYHRNYYAIYFKDSSNSEVTGCRIVGYDASVFITNSNHISVSGNLIEAQGYYGVYIGSSECCRVVNNKMKGHYPVYVTSSYSTIVSNNQIYYSYNAGIHLHYSNDSIISSNRISGGEGIGIELYDSDKNVVANNKITTYTRAIDYAMVLYLSDKNVVIGNEIMDCYDKREVFNVTALYIDRSDGNIVASNVFVNNTGYGIYITEGYDNVIKNNDVSGNGLGSIIDDGFGTVIRGNAGYITENSGKLTNIPINGTGGALQKFPIAHGLSVPSTDDDFRVTLTLTEPTATDFTVELLYWQPNTTNTDYFDAFIKVTDSLTEGATVNCTWTAWVR